MILLWYLFQWKNTLLMLLMDHALTNQTKRNLRASLSFSFSPSLKVNSTSAMLLFLLHNKLMKLNAIEQLLCLIKGGKSIGVVDGLCIKLSYSAASTLIQLVQLGFHRPKAAARPEYEYRDPNLVESDWLVLMCIDHQKMLFPAVAMN